MLAELLFQSPASQFLLTQDVLQFDLLVQVGLHIVERPADILLQFDCYVSRLPDDQLPG